MKVNLYINIVQWVICCTCFRLNGRDIVMLSTKLKLRTFIAQVVVMQTLLTDDSVTPSTFRLETFFKDHLKLAIPLRKTILACKIRHLAIKSFKIFKYLILHFHSLGQWIKVTSQAVEQKFWFTTQELRVLRQSAFVHQEKVQLACTGVVEHSSKLLLLPSPLKIS